MKKALLILFIFFTALLFAQRITSFNVFQVNNSVALKFTIGPGPSCNGYNILHSADSVFYTTIYDYPGICGNSSSEDNQSWTHSSPTLNQTNYYKVQLNPGETTLAKSIFIVPQTKASLFAYPNPIQSYADILNLRFTGANNLRVVGYIYDQFGKPLEELDLRTVVDTSTLDIGRYNNGLYFIWLTDGLLAYASKFIIQR